MHCPYCRHNDSKVLDSRVSEDGSSIRRRRQCPVCERRFTTLEQMQLSVVKKSGVIEPFVRDKVVSGVRKACKGRPVNEDQLAKLGQQVEDALRASGQPEVPADDVGVAILGPLRELDQVAYLRFASVYRRYESVDDFEDEIALLRVEQEPLGIEPLLPELAVGPARAARTTRASRPTRPGANRRSTRSGPVGDQSAPRPNGARADRDRGSDRNPDRNPGRNSDRNPDRNLKPSPDRGPDTS